MPVFRPELAEYITEEVEGQSLRMLSKASCDSFNANLLGLGDLTRPASPTDAIAAVFDLEGFTNFCKQIEPHLSVPLFLSEFLSWLMERLKNEMIKESHPAGSELWSPLPFFTKFMGDGVLVLWETADMDDASRRNVIVSAANICNDYIASFLPKIGTKVADAPGALRCGIARGTVHSVGDGNDFVGSCINMAARIQTLPGLRFAFNRRGFNLEAPEDSKFNRESLIVKKVSIRGIGENELIAIRKDDFDAMSKDDQKTYREA